MLELYKRIKDERLRHGMTQTELAEKIGYSDKSMISYIENGKVDLTQSKILLFAEVFGVSASYLMGNDGTEESVPNYKNVIPITTKRYPVLGEIACGKPVFCNEEKESYVVAGTEINADFCLIAHGDSMIGARIHDGDVVFIRQQTMVDNGEIAAVVIDNEATLKRMYYYKDEQIVNLVAENPKYAPMVYKNDDLSNIYILGKAVAFQSDVK